MNIEDPGELRHYLITSGRLRSDAPLKVEVLAGGVSSRTVRVEVAEQPAWVLKQSLPKLRVPMDWFSDPQRIHREALGLRALQSLLPSGTVPKFLFEDFSCQLLAMEAVPQPHENWKSALLAGHLDLDHVDQFALLLASLHRRGWQQRAALSESFADWSYFESLRLEPYYLCSAQQAPEARPFLEQLVDRTRRRRLTLVHGDFSPKNVLVHDSRLVLLDHEVIHFGDPAFDLGFALTHLLSKGHHLREHRQRFGEAAVRFLSKYERSLGGVPWQDDLPWHILQHTMGCLLARIVGRSPLEYLADDERRQQRQAVVELIHDPPTSLNQLSVEFFQKVDR